MRSASVKRGKARYLSFSGETYSLSNANVLDWCVRREFARHMPLLHDGWSDASVLKIGFFLLMDVMENAAIVLESDWKYI